MMAVSLSPAGVAVTRRPCCPYTGVASSSVRSASASSSSSSSSSSSCRLSLSSIFCAPKESKRSRLGSRAVTEVAEVTGAGLRTEPDAPAGAEPSVSDVDVTHSNTFLGLTSEEELLEGIRKEVQAKRLPKRGGAGLTELYCNYRDAVLESGIPNARELVVKIMATVCDRILWQFEHPFTFQPHHERMIDPYNYYEFGQNYIRPLINFENSFVGNRQTFDEVEHYLQQGHNIVLYSNHQTEADPAVIALLLESSHPYLSENLTYVAGDRVVSDPFCMPFSMGRNLFCVYSKKHINDVPEEAEMKQKANRRTLSVMCEQLSEEKGVLIWIAPSGGRDRPDPINDQWKPAAFDSSAVDHMRRLMLTHGKAPGHIYALSLLCYDVMPPPKKVEKEIGEKRLMNYTGCGLAVSPELKFDEITAGIKDLKREGKEIFSQVIYKIVDSQYAVLDQAINGGKGLSASNLQVQLSQPWNEPDSLTQ